eukprot:Skav201307  [mRNA]  locus=scaffold1490:57493:61534:- [translate_table: standard]
MLPRTKPAVVLAGPAMLDAGIACPMEAKSRKIQLRDELLHVETVVHSDHTDSRGISEMISQVSPQQVVLVHGAETLMKTFQPIVKKRLRVPCFSPGVGEAVELQTPAAVQVRVLPDENQGLGQHGPAARQGSGASSTGILDPEKIWEDAREVLELQWKDVSCTLRREAQLLGAFGAVESRQGRTNKTYEVRRKEIAFFKCGARRQVGSSHFQITVLWDRQSDKVRTFFEVQTLIFLHEEELFGTLPRLSYVEGGSSDAFHAMDASMAAELEEVPLVEEKTNQRHVTICTRATVIAVTLALSALSAFSALSVGYLNEEYFRSGHRTKVSFPTQKDVQTVLELIQERLLRTIVFKELKSLNVDNSDPKQIKFTKKDWYLDCQSFLEHIKSCEEQFRTTMATDLT